MSEKLSPRQRHLMRHALGLNQAAEEYRNYFAAGPADLPDWEALVAMGYAERGQGGNVLAGFCVTEAGRAALGGQQ